jgi:hypothetical protein
MEIFPVIVALFLRQYGRFERETIQAGDSK